MSAAPSPAPAPAAAAAAPALRWRVVVWLVSAAAGCVGLWAGWRFGDQVAGLWLAIIAAANCGALFALLAGHAADGLVERLTRRRSR
jgi:hypothetical protein